VQATHETNRASGFWVMAFLHSTVATKPIDRSDRELQALFRQLVRDLLCSPTYRTAIERLEATPADRDPAAVQRAAQTIARHAILTTLKHFRSRPAIMPIPTTHPPLPLPPRPTARSTRKHAHRAAQRHTDIDRQRAYLQTLGSRLRARRQSCRFSLAQLHHLTKIPLQHLQAFESGQLDALPTNPSYLWGTIRIWGNVLGLDGLKLATGIPDCPNTELPIASVPPTSAPPQPIATETKPESGDGFARCVTYGTLAAGAIVGLHWLTDSQNAPASYSSEPLPAPTASERQRQSEIQRAILPSDVSPPQGLRRHLRRD